MEARDANFTLTNTSLTIGGEVDTLSGIEQGELARGDGVNTLLESGNTWFILTNTTLDMAEGASETVTITLTGVSDGYFTLIFDGQETQPIDADADLFELKSILGALSNIGDDNIKVTGNAGAWTVTFTNTLGGKNVADLMGTATFSSGSLAVTVVTNGSTSVNTLANSRWLSLMAVSATT